MMEEYELNSEPSERLDGKDEDDGENRLLKWSGDHFSLYLIFPLVFNSNAILKLSFSLQPVDYPPGYVPSDDKSSKNLIGSAKGKSQCSISFIYP